MRGLLEAAVLLAPALATPLTPGRAGDAASAFIRLDIPQTQERSIGADTLLRLAVLESAEPCGTANVTLNGQPLTHDEAGLGSGSLTTEHGSLIIASWKFACVELDEGRREQALELNVEFVDGREVADVGFTAQFQQTAPARVSFVNGAQSVIPAPGQPQDAQHNQELQTQRAELDAMKWQLVELEQAIFKKEQFIAEAFGFREESPKDADCDNLRCMFLSMYDSVKDVAAKFYGNGMDDVNFFRSRPGKHHGHGPGWGRGRHGRPGHFFGPDHGNHTHGNHTHPPPPFPPPPPFCHCPPPPPFSYPPPPPPFSYPPPPGPGGMPPPPPGGMPPPPPGGMPPPPPGGMPPPPPGGMPPPPPGGMPPPPPGGMPPPPPGGMPPPPPGGMPPAPPGDAPPPPPDATGPPPPPPNGPPTDSPDNAPPAPPFGRPDQGKGPDGRPPFDGPDGHPPFEGHDHDGRPPFEGHDHDGRPPFEGHDHDGRPPFDGPDGRPPFEGHNRDGRPPFEGKGAGRHHPPPPPGLELLRAIPAFRVLAVVVTLGLLLAALHTRCFTSHREERRSCLGGRRERRRARRSGFSAAYGRMTRRLCGSRYVDEEEEKEAMLRQQDEDDSDSEAMSTTMEQDIEQFRNAAEVVGDMVAAEEGRMRQHMVQYPTVRVPPSPHTVFPEYLPVDDVLPAYEAGPSDDSDYVADGMVADGMHYTPGTSTYTPSESSAHSSLDEHLGRKQ